MRLAVGGWRPGTRTRLVLRELVVILASVGIYFAVRGRTEGSLGAADANARSVLAVEEWLHIDWERPIQDSADQPHLLTSFVNWVYIWGHWPVIAATLLWLVLRHPARYRLTRNAILLSGAVGMVVFATFPVTPPRLLGLGLVDTVTEYSTSYRVLQPPAFVNKYAAMPSLHMGWDLLIGMAIVACAARWWVRLLGALLPLLMAWAVVATANHYVLDAVAGVALVLAAFALARQLPEWWLSWRRRRAPSPPRVTIPRPRQRPDARPDETAERPADEPEHSAGGRAGHRS